MPTAFALVSMASAAKTPETMIPTVRGVSSGSAGGAPRSPCRPQRRAQTATTANSVTIASVWSRLPYAAIQGAVANSAPVIRLVRRSKSRSSSTSNTSSVATHTTETTPCDARSTCGESPEGPRIGSLRPSAPERRATCRPATPAHMVVTPGMVGFCRCWDGSAAEASPGLPSAIERLKLSDRCSQRFSS